MKRSRITAASLGILALVIIAFGVMMAVNQAEEELEMQAMEFERLRSLSHELEATGFELVAISDDLRSMLDKWSVQIAALDAEIDRLLMETDDDDTLRVHVARVENLWSLRQDLLESYQRSIERLLQSFPELEKSNPGLLGLYQKSLIDSTIPTAVTADLGFVADNVDRLEMTSREFEHEVVAILEMISERNARFDKLSNFIIAFILVAVVAGTAVILIRINRLHRSVVADNAARREAERTARRSERDLLTTLQSIGEAVFVIDSQGRISRMNNAAERLTGWAAEDAVGRPAASIIRVADPSGEDRPVTEIFPQSSASMTGPDLNLTRRDGSIRRVNGSCSPLRSVSGVDSGAVLAIRDVTKRHQLEQRLRQTQKLESIGQLAGGVAHDFNNLLQVVLGNVAMLGSAENLSPEQREIVREIQHAGRRAAELTDQLLAFSRRQTLAVRSENLAALVERSVSMVRRLCPPQTQIKFRDRGHKLHVLADPNQLEQVLINLILNSRDAMPDGGRITIAISEVEIGMTRDEAGPERTGRFGCLRVTDTGVGMTEEVRKRVFEPFFTTKDVGAGSGLGLSMVHGIVQQHGGFIQIDSEPGNGTTVAVHIPIDPNKAIEVSKPTEAPRHPEAQAPGRKILVAEDDPSVRSLIERLLRKAGHELLLATNGSEACDLIDLEPDSIDLILTDIVMPEVDGVAVAHHARRRYNSIPVVFCTGHPESLKGKEMVEHPWLLLRKPWSITEFRATLHEALKGIGNQAGV